MTTGTSKFSPLERLGSWWHHRTAVMVGVAVPVWVALGMAVGTMIGAIVNDWLGAVLGLLIGGASVLIFSEQIYRLETTRTRHWRWAHGLAFAVGFLALIVMGELNTLLAFMRSAGEPARDITFLTASLDLEAVRMAIDGFESFDADLNRTRDARAVMWGYVFIDSVLFVWAYAMIWSRIICQRWEMLTEELPHERLANEEARRLRNARKFLEWAAASVPLVAGVDWLENLAVGTLVEAAWGNESTALLRFLVVATTLLFALKWFLAAMVACLVIAERVASRRRWFAIGGGTVREAVSRLRPMVITWLVLAVFLLQPLQVPDVLLRLGELGPQVGYAAMAALWLALTILAWGSLLQRTRPIDGRTRFDDGGLLRYGSAWTVASIVLVFGFGWHWIVAAPGLLAVVVGAGGRGLDDRVEPRVGQASQEAGQERKMYPFLPALLASGVPIVLGTAMIRAGFADAFFLQDGSEARAAVLIGLALLVVGGGVWLLDLLVGRYVGDLDEDAGLALVRRIARVTLVGSVLAAALCLTAVLWDAVAVGRSVGALALFLVFLSSLAGLAGWLTRWSDQIKPPTLFRQLSMRRIPVFALLGIWLLAGQYFLDRSDHAIRSDIELPTASGAVPAGCSASPPVAPTPDQAWTWWMATNGLGPETMQNVAPRELASQEVTLEDETAPDEASDAAADAAADAGERTGYPVILVAASGGGIRAAWWTAAVMGRLADEAGAACLNAPPTDFGIRQVFAASGISGGSLGLAAHQGAVVGGTRIGVELNWVDQPLGQDHLSPALAWFTYIEIPRSLLGFPFSRDRAQVMEESWEQAWERESLGLGLRSSWRSFPQLPILAINGATVNDGCRVLITVLDVATDPNDCRPGDASLDEDNMELQMERAEMRPTERLALAETYSMQTLVCSGRDLRLSTSALLSARFPLISPAGRMESCDGGRTIEVVDGGYRDANGAETAYDLWRQIEPFVRAYNDDPDSPHCLVPMFVQIDDDFRLEAPKEDKRRWPPLLAPAKAILEARGAQSKAGDFDIRSAIPAIDRITIEPTAAPGVHPSLGWSLSRTTRSKMKSQVGVEATHSEGGITRLRARTKNILTTSCDELIS